MELYWIYLFKNRDWPVFGRHSILNPTDNDSKLPSPIRDEPWRLQCSHAYTIQPWRK